MGPVHLFIAITSWRRFICTVHDWHDVSAKKLITYTCFYHVATPESHFRQLSALTVGNSFRATGRPTARGGGARASSWGGARREKKPLGDRGTCAGARTAGMPEEAKNSPKNVENGRGAKSGA